MDTKTFWAMIDEVRENGPKDGIERYEYFIERLSQLSAEEISEANRILRKLWRRSQRADLWEAAWLVTCLVTDSAFELFQYWLIGQGQTTYEKVLEDPDNLADVVDEKDRFSIYDGWTVNAAFEAYERKTGEWIPETEYEYEERQILSIADEEAIPAKFPRLRAKFGDCSEPTI